MIKSFLGYGMKVSVVLLIIFFYHFSSYWMMRVFYGKLIELVNELNLLATRCPSYGFLLLMEK